MDISKKDICDLPACKCGWNITISGWSKKSFNLLQEFVRANKLLDYDWYDEEMGITKRMIENKKRVPLEI